MARLPGRPKTGGRTKGTPNKFTASIKEAFQIAFEEMGGVEALAAWGKENPTEFYKLVGRLIPLDIEAKVQGMTHEEALELLS
jgi:hypothetical protein